MSRRVILPFLLLQFDVCQGGKFLKSIQTGAISFFQRTPSERIHLAETDRTHLDALEKFSTLADIKLKEKERQYHSSARSAQL